MVDVDARAAGELGAARRREDGVAGAETLSLLARRAALCTWRPGPARGRRSVCGGPRNRLIVAPRTAPKNSPLLKGIGRGSATARSGDVNIRTLDSSTADPELVRLHVDGLRVDTWATAATRRHGARHEGQRRGSIADAAAPSSASSAIKCGRTGLGHARDHVTRFWSRFRARSCACTSSALSRSPTQDHARPSRRTAFASEQGDTETQVKSCFNRPNSDRLLEWGGPLQL